MVHRYNTCLIKLLDQHAPVVTKKVLSRRRFPWYNREISQLKCQQRKLERQWRQTRLTVHHQMYADHHTLLNKVFLNKILVAGNDPKQQNSVINQLQHKNIPKQWPDHKYSSELANKFLHFFDTKIANIRAEMASAAQNGRYKNDMILVDNLCSISNCQQ